MSEKYLTRTELGARWCLTKQSIINKEKAKLIPVFYLPGSKRPRYPLSKILEIEKRETFVPEFITEKEKSGVDWNVE